MRELERLVERTVTLAASDVIGLEDLPISAAGAHLEALGPSLTQNESLRAWARRYVRIVLDRHSGNRRHAARALGISYHTLKAYLRAPVGAAKATADAATDWPGAEEAEAIGATGAA